MSLQGKLAWAAGFLEGEGSFEFSQGATVRAGQVQQMPLTRLHAWFGGKLYKAKTPLGSPMGRWQIFGAHAVALMLTLYPLMSPNRQARIRYVVERWKRPPGRQRHASVRPRNADGSFI